MTPERKIECLQEQIDSMACSIGKILHEKQKEIDTLKTQITALECRLKEKTE